MIYIYVFFFYIWYCLSPYVFKNYVQFLFPSIHDLIRNFFRYNFFFRYKFTANRAVLHNSHKVEIPVFRLDRDSTYKLLIYTIAIMPLRLRLSSASFLPMVAAIRSLAKRRSSRENMAPFCVFTVTV